MVVSPGGVVAGLVSRGRRTRRDSRRRCRTPRMDDVAGRLPGKKAVRWKFAKNTPTSKGNVP
eukprot:6316711-Prymnesium_polylepis.1